MRGLVSFHPVDPDFFDGIVMPLVAGDRINPEPFLDAALAFRRTAWRVAAWRAAIEDALATLTPPPPPEFGTMWERVRARLERFDHRPSPVAFTLGRVVEPELHLVGRPFLVAEGSAERVAAVVDDYLATRADEDVDALVRQQLFRFDPGLRDALAPGAVDPPEPELSVRSRLLAELKALYDLGAGARGGGERVALGTAGDSAEDVLARVLMFRAVDLHARAVPCWVGRDVDGLGPICASAGIEPPPFLRAPLALCSPALDVAPALERMTAELTGPEDVGAWVAPQDVPELGAFLAAEGARIIREATRQGAGAECATVLRKIRECAAYAERRGVGYLEACGVLPPGPAPVADEELVESL